MVSCVAHCCLLQLVFLGHQLFRQGGTTRLTRYGFVVIALGIERSEETADESVGTTPRDLLPMHRSRSGTRDYGGATTELRREIQDDQRSYLECWSYAHLLGNACSMRRGIKMNRRALLDASQMPVPAGPRSRSLCNSPAQNNQSTTPTRSPWSRRDQIHSGRRIQQLPSQ